MSVAVDRVHPYQASAKAGRDPFKVADLGLAEWGRKEIWLAEEEMPGLMSLRARYEGKKPLAGARIMGSLHMTIQTAVLIETLADLGADVRWASCNIFSTQDHAAAARGRRTSGDGRHAGEPEGIPVFAWKGETLEEYWWCTSEALIWPDGKRPDADRGRWRRRDPVVHKAVEYERNRVGAGVQPGRRAEEWGVILGLLRHEIQNHKGRWTKIATAMKGRQRGDDDGRPPALPDGGGRHAALPAHQRQRLGDQEQVRQHLRVPSLGGGRHQPRQRRHDGRQGRRRRGLRRGGQGLRAGAARQGCRVIVTEIDPICALQAAMEGYEIATIEDVVGRGRHLRDGDGQLQRHHGAHMAKMKDKAIVGNIGHFDNEIDMAGLKKIPGIQRINIKPSTTSGASRTATA